MPIALVLPDGYGYVSMIALGVVPFIALGQGAVVTQRRKAAGVSYPNAYATHDQAKNNPAAYRFNCAQRAHGNFMENMPQAIATMLFSGLFYPQAAAALGAVWSVSRILYAYGYITSDKPNGGGRMIGGAFWLAQLGLWGMSIYSSLKLI